MRTEAKAFVVSIAIMAFLALVVLVSAPLAAHWIDIITAFWADA